MFKCTLGGMLRRVGGAEHAFDGFAIRAVADEPKSQFRRERMAEFGFDLLKLIFV